MNTSDTKTFTFSAADFEGRKNAFKVYDEGVQWPVILNDFLEFLEYTGYVGVRKRVSIQESPFMEHCWNGPTHEGTKEDY